MGPEPPNQDDTDGDLNLVLGPDDASNATKEGKEPSHLSHMWWLPGTAPLKTPERYQYTKEDA
eukprot:14244625-Ditylum_brightwellii.AAC.1